MLASTISNASLDIHYLCSTNPYLQGFNSYYDRFKEDGERHPTKAMSVRIQQLEAECENRGNRLTQMRLLTL